MSPTISLRRGITLAAASATALSGVLLAGATPAAAAPTYTYAVTQTVGVGADPAAVAVNPVTNKIYVANHFDNTVSVIDGATNAVTSVDIGSPSLAVAVNPKTNMIYAVTGGSNVVAVINGATNAVTQLPDDGTPNAVAVNSTTNMIYVANFINNTVSVINGATNAVTQVGVGYNPTTLAVDEQTNMIYVGNVSTHAVSVINGATNAVTQVGVGDYPYTVAVNPITNMIYVPNSNYSTVSVINGVTNAVTSVPAGDTPSALDVNTTTNMIYVANSWGNTVTVINGATNAVTQVGVGARPSAVAVNPITNMIYVSNSFDNTVSVINGATNAVTPLPVGDYPSAVAVNPVTDTAYVVNDADAGTVSVIAKVVVTATTLSSSPSPTAGTSVRLTATIDPNPGGGSAGFTDGGNPITGCTSQPVDPATSEATCTVTFSSSGAHTIGASYTGTTGYAGSAASPLTLGVAAAPTPAPVVSRVAGADRYATAVAASATRFGTGGADAVVLATGANYPDGLVGVPLAAAKNAPLLLTTGTTLPAVTRAELLRVLPTGRTVYVLGSTAAIPTSTSTELAGLGYTVTRLGGPDRYATAVKVADALGDPATVLLASGVNYPDALAAGPAAAKTGGVVLLTTGTSIGAATSAYLSAHPGAVYAAGGPAAAADPAATAIAGADRYATATAVATRFFPAPSHVGVATGTNYPDALSGGALLAANGGPMLLADTGHTNPATTYLSQVRAGLITSWVFGDTNAVPAGVVDTLTTTLHP